MLGDLLLVDEHLGLEREVFCVTAAAWTSAGDRSGAHDAVVHAHQHFGRRPDDLMLARVEQIHVRRGVERAQHAIEGERVDVLARRNCWLGTTWKMSPATMYFFARSTMSL